MRCHPILISFQILFRYWYWRYRDKEWPSKNSDIYSFEVVVLELLTGWEVVDYQRSNACLLTWVYMLVCVYGYKFLAMQKLIYSLQNAG
jgi:hypothetical protein